MTEGKATSSHLPSDGLLWFGRACRGGWPHHNSCPWCVPMDKVIQALVLGAARHCLAGGVQMGEDSSQRRQSNQIQTSFSFIYYYSMRTGRGGTEQGTPFPPFPLQVASSSSSSSSQPFKSTPFPFFHLARSRCLFLGERQADRPETDQTHRQPRETGLIGAAGSYWTGTDPTNTTYLATLL